MWYNGSPDICDLKKTQDKPVDLRYTSRSNKPTSHMEPEPLVNMGHNGVIFLMI